jgi:hypothetical protein
LPIHADRRQIFKNQSHQATIENPNTPINPANPEILSIFFRHVLPIHADRRQIFQNQSHQEQSRKK